MFAPLFNKLFDNKVVYQERFVGIVKLEDVKISPDFFSAKAVPQLVLERGTRFDELFFLRSWEFSSRWDFIRLMPDDSLNSPYANWSIWCDPDTVRKTEELIIRKDFSEAMQFIEKR